MKKRRTRQPPTPSIEAGVRFVRSRRLGQARVADVRPRTTLDESQSPSTRPTRFSVKNVSFNGGERKRTPAECAMHNPYLSEIIFALFFFKMTTFLPTPIFSRTMTRHVRKIGGSRTRKRLVNVWYPSTSRNDAPFLFAFRRSKFIAFCVRAAVLKTVKKRSHRLLVRKSAFAKTGTTIQSKK